MDSYTKCIIIYFPFACTSQDKGTDNSIKQIASKQHIKWYQGSLALDKRCRNQIWVNGSSVSDLCLAVWMLTLCHTTSL